MKKCPGKNCQRKIDCQRYEEDSKEGIGCYSIIDGHMFEGYRKHLPLDKNSFIYKKKEDQVYPIFGGF